MNGFDSYRVRERADIAQVVLIAVFVLLAGAFFRTQVIQHEKFQLRAETNRLRPISLTAPRGTIFDRNGGVIAENVPGYSEGASTFTEYPGTFSAMTPPFRSKMVPRGAVSEIGDRKSVV